MASGSYFIQEWVSAIDGASSAAIVGCSAIVVACCSGHIGPRIGDAIAAMVTSASAADFMMVVDMHSFLHNNRFRYLHSGWCSTPGGH